MSATKAGKDKLSPAARRDLIFIGVGMVVVFVLEFVTRLATNLIVYLQSISFFDPGELVAVPLALAVGFGIFSYRRYQEISDAVAARERAQAAARQARQETERAQMEAGRVQEEAEELQRMNRALVEAEVNVLVKVDASGRVLDVNEGMQTATGLSKDHLLGTDAFSYFERPEKAGEALDNAVRSGSATSAAGMRVKNVKGDGIPVSFRASSYKNSAGEQVGVLICRRQEE